MEEEKDLMKVSIECDKWVGPFIRELINMTVTSMLKTLAHLELLEGITKISIERATEEDIDEEIINETRRKSEGK